MSEQDNTPNYEEMSDDDFLALNEPITPDVAEDDVQEQQSEEKSDEQITAEDAPDPDGKSEENDNDDNSGSDGAEETSSDSGSEDDKPDESDTSGATDPMAGEGTDADEGKKAEDSAEEKKADDKSEEEGKDESDKDSEKQLALPDGVTVEQVNEALSFYEQITAPFKADGRDMSVRNAADAIRLMQQGANYSRRMQELKPIKHIHRMLTDNGLADQTKLNFAIDLMKGDKTAITKLLKDHNIDTMDLDTNSEVSYQGNNYAGNAQANAFRDELENIMSTSSGEALVTDIQANWDTTSKNKLQEDPSILGNLNQMYSSGVYKRIVDEMTYQRSVGGLSPNAPFLESYDRVGKAMAEAGAFKDIDQKTEHQGKLQIQQRPIASGTRKAATPKNAPNPHLSSAPASKSSSPAPQKQEFGALSDEEFNKLTPPT